MTQAHVIVFCTPASILARVVASFRRQTYTDKTLHLICIGGVLETPPEFEQVSEDIRIYNLPDEAHAEPLREVFKSGYVFFFNPDYLYLPWHITRMAQKWTSSKRRAFSPARMLVFNGSSAAPDGPGMWQFAESGPDAFNTIFQANEVHRCGLNPGEVMRRVQMEAHVEHEEGHGCPSYAIIHDKREKFAEGLTLVDLSARIDEAQAVLRNAIKISGNMIPRTEDGKPVPGDLSDSLLAEIADIKAWLPRRLQMVCVISDDSYHTWQALVMLHNFKKFGFIDRVRLLVYYQYSNPNPILINSLKEHFPEVGVYYYKDEGANIPGYKSVLRPHVLARHWEEYPELQHDAIFYHDVDIIFSRKPDFDALASGPACYTAEARDYIGAESYILKKQRGDVVLGQLVGIVGISPDMAIARDHESGGAQYIIKDVDADFWRKVERDCVLLHLAMLRINRDILGPATTPEMASNGQTEHIQAWCADMWAVLWNLWRIGKHTHISPEISHSWGSDEGYKWPQFPIMHNAGVTEQMRVQLKHFAKTRYVDKWPDDLDLTDFSDLWNSYNYAREVKEFFDLWAK